MKFVKPPGFAEGLAKLGLPENQANGLGVIELVCTALYVIPQTSVLGAILLTGILEAQQQPTSASVIPGLPPY